MEDEDYIAAALGCTLGIMRYPLTGLRPGDDVDLFLFGPRQIKKRINETVRVKTPQGFRMP